MSLWKPKVHSHITQYFVIEARPILIGCIFRCHFSVYANFLCHFCGIDIGPQEDKLPVPFCFHFLYGCLYLRARILRTGVFIAIGNNDKEYLVIWSLFRGYGMDGPAYGIIQGRTSADVVLIVGHRFYLVDIHPVVKQFIFIVKKDGGNQAFSLCRLLLLQHSIETADGVCFQSTHGSTPVENKYEFSSVVFHC